MVRQVEEMEPGNMSDDDLMSMKQNSMTYTIPKVQVLSRVNNLS